MKLNSNKLMPQNNGQNILRDDIEYIIHSDFEGNIIGPISKDHAHMGLVRVVLTHYSTWSMIYNQKTWKYGIQLKNPKKHDKYGAWKWDMGFAGHNCYIKDEGIFRPLWFNENLVKEAKEEIWIDIEMCNSKGDFKKNIENNLDKSTGFIFEEFHYKTDVNNEWVWLWFIVVSSELVKFEDWEVVDFKWLLPEELNSFLENNDNYCSPLPLVFEKAEKFRKIIF